MYEDRYIVLSSKDSLHLYPENKMSNFRVKMSRRLHLKGNWECACVRFSFTNSLCTFNEPQQIFITNTQTKKRVVEMLIAPQRFQSLARLIMVINETVEQEVEISEGDRLPGLMTDQHDRVQAYFGSINGEKYHLEFGDSLVIILGLNRDGFYFMDAFKTNLYVYLDCLKSRIVADAKVPLLTTIDIGNVEKEPGEQTVIKINKPEYTMIAHSEFDEIEVQILDDTGKPPIFEFGVVTITLHLRET